MIIQPRFRPTIRFHFDKEAQVWRPESQVLRNIDFSVRDPKEAALIFPGADLEFVATPADPPPYDDTMDPCSPNFDLNSWL